MPKICSPAIVRALSTQAHRRTIFANAFPDGTAMDTSLLLDYISTYAFPTHSIQISEHIVLGISLGGHAAWQCLLHDSPITSAVICIRCADYTPLMSDRARLSTLPTYTQRQP